MIKDKSPEDHKEKKISPVAGSNKRGNMFGVIVIVLTTMLFIYSIQNKKENVEPSVKPEKFSVATTNDSSFVSRRDVYAEPKKKRKNKELTAEQIELLRRLVIEKAQKKQNKEKEKEAAIKVEKAKRKSQMMIFSSKSKNTDKIKDSTEISLLGLLPQNNPKKTENDKHNTPSPELLDVTQVKLIPNLSRTLTAGKFIKGVLETAINSTLPGQVRAVVSSDIYSENGAKVLLEKGTRLIGNYQAGIRQGQARVYVIWSTAITTNGYQVPLASTGTDALGTTGLAGDYDSHFFQRFGGAMLLSVIESQNAGGGQLNVGAQNSLSTASAVALNNSINIPPTIYVDQGEIINIFVARNIVF